MVTLVDRKVRKDEKKERDRRKRREGGGKMTEMKNESSSPMNYAFAMNECKAIRVNTKMNTSDSAASQICGQPLKPYSHSIPKNVACLCSTRAALQSRARYARMGGQTGSTTPFHIYPAIVNE